MCDLDYGYMGFAQNIKKIKGKTVQYDDMSIESACENENNVLLLKGGKNLIDLSNFTPISFPTIQATKEGNIITIKGLRTSDVESVTDPKLCNLKVYLEEGKTYSVSFKSDGDFGVTVGTDTVEIFFMLDGTSKHYFNVAGQRTVTIPKGRSGYYYIRFDVNSGDKTHKFWDIQVYDVTDYESNTSNIPLPQPLRSLPNGVCDEVVGNKVIQNIYELKLDSNFDFARNVTIGPTPTDTTLYRFDINPPYPTPIGDINSVISNMFPYLYIHGLPGGGANAVKQECVSNHSVNKNMISVVIKKGKLNSVDVTGFKHWCIANNFKIFYQLETPKEHTINVNIKKIKKSKCLNKIKPTII